MDFPPFLRCTRTGNGNWRCEAMAAPGRSYCQKHYLEQKRRNERKRDRKRSKSDYSRRGRNLSSEEDDEYDDEDYDFDVENDDEKNIEEEEESVAYYMSQVLPREHERVKSLHKLEKVKSPSFDEENDEGKFSRWISGRRNGDEGRRHDTDVGVMVENLGVGRKRSMMCRKKRDFRVEVSNLESPPGTKDQNSSKRMASNEEQENCFVNDEVAEPESEISSHLEEGSVEEPELINTTLVSRKGSTEEKVGVDVLQFIGISLLSLIILQHYNILLQLQMNHVFRRFKSAMFFRRMKAHPSLLRRCFSSNIDVGSAITELNKEMESIFGDIPPTMNSSQSNQEFHSISHDSSEREAHLTHVNSSGEARMVDITVKDDSKRIAIASCKVLLGQNVFSLVSANQIAKGDVLNVAKIAGISGAKQTSHLIPLCHTISLTHVNVDLTLNEKDHSVDIIGEAATTGKTGVEMEALTAVSVAGLTVYDMCKAASKDIQITGIRLDVKAGGKSGTWTRK